MDADAILRAIATIAATTLDNVRGSRHELDDLMRDRIMLIRDLASQAVTKGVRT